MKKWVLLLATMTLFTIASQAQLRLGAKAGVNISGVSGDNIDDFIDKNVVGFYVGPSLEWMFAGKIGFDASLLYSQKGVEFKDEDAQRTSYIEIPANLKFRLPLGEHFGILLGAGPYIDFRISGDDNFDVIMDNVSTQWEQKSFAAGLNFNAGVEIFKFLQVGANYGLGLTENYKDSDGSYSAKERVWSVFATVYF